jgi:hypothetical protein
MKFAVWYTTPFDVTPPWLEPHQPRDVRAFVLEAKDEQQAVDVWGRMMKGDGAQILRVEPLEH